MSQLLEKAFHLRLKRFASTRLQGYVMGAFREVMELAEKPSEATLAEASITRYAVHNGELIRTRAGTLVTLPDCVEYAAANKSAGYRAGFAAGHVIGVSAGMAQASIESDKESERE